MQNILGPNILFGDFFKKHFSLVGPFIVKETRCRTFWGPNILIEDILVSAIKEIDCRAFWSPSCLFRS